LGILGHGDFGKRKRNVPLIHAHPQPVNDFQWNPYFDWHLATASTDATVKLWKLPEDGLSDDLTVPDATLKGHGKRVDVLQWHPSACNVLASGGGDNTVRIWDTSAEQDKHVIEGFKDAIWGLAWNYDGSLLAVTSKDKKIRLVDPRAKSFVQEVDGHDGTKGSQVVWLGQSGRFVTTGSNKLREREFAMWDTKNGLTKLKSQSVDCGTSVLTANYDVDTEVLFVTGRGDSTVKLFEMKSDAPYFSELTPFVMPEQHRGICLVPKAGLDVMSAEVDRLLKVTANAVIPIRFTVPRKTYSDFHADLFPETRGGEPALTQDEWFAGENRAPKLVSLAPEGVTIANESSSSNVSTPTSTSNNNSPAVSHSTNAGSGKNSPNPEGRRESFVSGGQKIEYKYIQAKTSDGAAFTIKQEVRVESNNVITVEHMPGEELEEDDPDSEFYVPKDIQITRSSKYKNIFGKPVNQNLFYTNLRVTNNAMATRSLSANPDFFAVPWEGVAGRVGVFSTKKTGKLTDLNVPVIETGSTVIDFEFSPFDNKLLATGGENGRVRLWKVPADGLTGLKANITAPDADLLNHNHKIVTVNFHPLVSNILVSTSGDLTAKLWDLNKNADVLTLRGFTDITTSVTWNYNGSLMATDSKDKKIRLWDPRQEKCVQEFDDVGGAQGSAVTWQGKQDQLICTGFNKMSERRIELIDIRGGGKKLTSFLVDSGSGFPTPVYDQDTGVLLFWGKGDSTLRFYELQNAEPYVHGLIDYKSNIPQIAISVLPKTICDVKNVEFMRTFKLSKDTVEVINFFVPRTRKEFFQDDVFPPTNSGEAVLDSSAWFSGQNKEPKLISLQPAGMKKLSEAPKLVRKVRRFNPEEEDMNDPKKLAAKVIDKYHERMQEWKDANAGEVIMPGQDKQGVDSDEWDD
jgi:coronin-7